jgi:hypothetical protein
MKKKMSMGGIELDRIVWCYVFSGEDLQLELYEEEGTLSFLVSFLDGTIRMLLLRRVGVLYPEL